MPSYINGCELSIDNSKRENLLKTNFLGPVNYVQLFGNINNIQKKITIFMDKHLDINNQTRCDSFDSTDISQYLYDLIKTADKPLDFFMEIDDYKIQQPITDKRDIYIKDVIEMFKTEFITEKDKVKYSKSNSNVRLHYLDIRDHLGIFYINKIIYIDIIPIIKSLKTNTINEQEKKYKIKIILQHIKLLEQFINKLYKNEMNIQSNQTNQDEQSKSKLFEKKSQNYYLNKLIHIYNNKDLKKNLNHFLNTNMTKFIHDIDKNISEIIGIIYRYKMNKEENNNFLDDLLSSLSELAIFVLKLYTLITVRKVNILIYLLF